MTDLTLAMMLTLFLVSQSDSTARFVSSAADLARGVDGVLSFGAVILAGVQVPELLHETAGPFDHHTVRAVAPRQPKRHRQLRLRQVARSGLHHARLRAVRRSDAHHRANAVAIRFRASQTQAQGPIAGCYIVAIKIRGALIGGDQQIEIAVAIEVAVRESAADFRRCETAAQLRRDVVETAFAVVQKKMRRLRITVIAGDVANGFVDMSVNCGEVEMPVEIGIEESAHPKPSRMRDA